MMNSLDFGDLKIVVKSPNGKEMQKNNIECPYNPDNRQEVGK